MARFKDASDGFSRGAEDDFRLFGSVFDAMIFKYCHASGQRCRHDDLFIDGGHERRRSTVAYACSLPTPTA